MAQITLARVDDRLIHGQVTVKWTRKIPCTEIVIADDAVRKDTFLQSVLRMAAPRGLPLKVYSVAEATADLADNSNHDGRKIMLILKTPQTALRLLEGGVTLPALNVGGIGAVPGARRVYKSVSVTLEQTAALDAIYERDVPIDFRTVPEEAGMTWEAVRKQVKN